MSFITMCHGTDCERKENCMHFTWKSHPQEQHYFDIHPLYEDKEDGLLKCREFHPNERNNPLYNSRIMP
jgi:hypothetical protein